MRQSLRSKKWSDFPTRVLTAVIGAPVVLLAVIFGAPLFDVLIFTLAVIAATEIHATICPKHRGGPLVMVGAMLMTVATIAYMSQFYFIFVMSLPVMILVNLALAPPTQNGIHWIHGGLYPVLGMLWVSVPLGMMILLRSDAAGLLWIMALMWGIWFTDTLALLGGRLIGQHKLAPKISPGKTIEGALVGVAGGIAITMTILIMANHPILLALLIGASVATMAVVGDLFQSFLKRYFKVKDAGSILPGHGGVLDRIDSFLGATPVYFLLLLAFGLL